MSSKEADTDDSVSVEGDGSEDSNEDVEAGRARGRPSSSVIDDVDTVTVVLVDAAL